MSPSILVLNAGSSSIKFALFDADDCGSYCRGAIDAIGSAARFKATGPCAARLASAGLPPAEATHAVATAWLLAALATQVPEVRVVMAGHRVVHGGARFAQPVLVDECVLSALDDLIELAPGHEPHNIAAIRTVGAVWPGVPQVACFDTAFHRTQPQLAQLFGLPIAYSEDGIVRYGFHGLSYDYIASVLPDLVGSRADGRVIVAHLGNGASMCAMNNRRSVATSMGYTGLDGLIMGTRCGALDAGVVLQLIGRRGMSVETVSDLLHHKSGLLGVSGISNDIRVLEASTDPRAAVALDLFAYRANRELGALVAVLGGLDVLVFTAGIGERAAGVRRRICEHAAWAGIALDHDANDAQRTVISRRGAAVDVLVIPTDEEIVIARAARALVPLGD